MRDSLWAFLSNLSLVFNFCVHFKLSYFFLSNTIHNTCLFLQKKRSPYPFHFSQYQLSQKLAEIIIKIDTWIVNVFICREGAVKLKCISTLTNGVQKDFFWYPTSLFNFLTLSIQALAANVKERKKQRLFDISWFLFL